MYVAGEIFSFSSNEPLQRRDDFCYRECLQQTGRPSPRRLPTWRLWYSGRRPGEEILLMDQI